MHGDLASSVEVAEDGLAVLFTLREQARFHPDRDGLAAPLTATEVQLDFERRAASGEFLFDAVVAAVEAPDARTLKLALRAPFALLFEYLGDPLTGSVRSMQRLTSGAWAGSGPFIPLDLPGGRELSRELMAHPAFHRPAVPLLERLHVRGVEAEEALDDLFARGEIDVCERPAFADRSLPGDGITQRQARPSRTVRALGLSLLGSKDGAEVRFVPAFQDERVRRAVGHALDRDALLAVDGAVLAGPVGPAHGADALAETELRTHAAYRHDPAEARSLLAAAGAAELAFTIEVSSRPALRDFARAVEEQLWQAGFAPRFRFRPPEEAAQLLERGDFEAILAELGPHTTPDRELRLHSSGGLDGRFSPWGYSNPVYDAAVRHALLAVNPGERAERSREAQRVLLNDAPALLPLTAPRELALLAPGVRGYEFDAFEFNGSFLSSEWRIEDGSPSGLPSGP